MVAILFRDAAPSYLESARRRNRNPLAPSTAKAYGSYLLNHLLPTIGDLPLAQVNNKSVKELIALLKTRDLANKTIIEIVGFVKIVVASIVDDEGNPIYPRKWNHEFMDLPTLGKQNRPTFTGEQVEQIIARAKPREAALYTLLAGSGLRIGEALATRLDGTEGQSHFSPDCRTLYLQSNMWRNQERSKLKTFSSDRDVDLCPEVAAFLKAYIGQRKSGLLFCADSGKPLFQTNILRNSLHPILKGREAFQSYRTVGGKKVKHILFPAIPGVTGKKTGFHAFRRFRITHLRTTAMVPDAYVKFWVGHGKKSITEEYTIIKEETAKRKELAEKAGLGFKLPRKFTSMKGGKAA